VLLREGRTRLRLIVCGGVSVITHRVMRRAEGTVKRHEGSLR
jgi:hypothetical protein